MFHRLRPLPLPPGDAASSQGPRDTGKLCALAVCSLWVSAGTGLNYCQVQLLVEPEVSAARPPPPLCLPQFAALDFGL